MKILITILCAFLIIQNGSAAKDPGEVIINGKVLNFPPEKSKVKLIINKPAFPPEELELDLDKSGRFATAFTENIPSDVYIDCGNAFYLLVHPGDSIYVEFNGQQKDFLKTIKFSGSAVKTNKDAAAFQQIYSSFSLYADADNYFKKIKESDPEEYSHFLDSCKLEWDGLYNKFVSHYNPDKETRDWISTFLMKEYYYNYSFYPPIHRQLNSLKESQWDVTEDYYYKLKEMLPLKESMTISTEALNSLINSYHYFYAFRRTVDENKQFMEDTTKTELERWSFIFNGVVNNTPDPLLRQMIITEMLADKLNHSEVELFEKEKKVIEEYVTEPYLREPLYQLYNRVKRDFRNPKIAADAVLKETAGLSAEHIIDSVIKNNAGKVIYIDCWATWCAPCLNEMPKSKSLMKELTGRDVAFVYVCIDSEEKIWKAALTKFQLGGQQYFLNKKQSNDFRKTYGIEGIPFYILIDKKGNIIEKDWRLRPETVKDKILKLL